MMMLLPLTCSMEVQVTVPVSLSCGQRTDTHGILRTPSEESHRHRRIQTDNYYCYHTQELRRLRHGMYAELWTGGKCPPRTRR